MTPACTNSLRALALVAAAAPIAAQQPAAPAPAVQDAAAGASSFVDAEVLLRAQAVQSEGGGADAAREPVGDVRDLLIDAGSGEVRLVGIEVDGKVHAVPRAEVTWDVQNRHWVVRWSKQRVQEAPVAVDGDLTKLRTAGEEADQGVDIARAEASAAAEALEVPLSKLVAARVEGQAGQVAASSAAVVETTSGNVAFLTFTAGARRVAVPFALVEVRSAEREDQSPDVWVALPKDHPPLAELPELPGPGALANPAVRQRVYDAFGATRPTFDPVEVGAGR